MLHGRFQSDVNPYALAYPLCTADGDAGANPHHAQRFRQLDLLFQGAGVLGPSSSSSSPNFTAAKLFAGRSLPGLYVSHTHTHTYLPFRGGRSLTHSLTP